MSMGCRLKDVDVIKSRLFEYAHFVANMGQHLCTKMPPLFSPRPAGQRGEYAHLMAKMDNMDNELYQRQYHEHGVQIERLLLLIRQHALNF